MFGSMLRGVLHDVDPERPRRRLVGHGNDAEETQRAHGRRCARPGSTRDEGEMNQASSRAGQDRRRVHEFGSLSSNAPPAGRKQSSVSRPPKPLPSASSSPKEGREKDRVSSRTVELPSPDPPRGASPVLHLKAAPLLDSRPHIPSRFAIVSISCSGSRMRRRVASRRARRPTLPRALALGTTEAICVTAEHLRFLNTQMGSY
jgi:hypothetical protein